MVNLVLLSIYYFVRIYDEKEKEGNIVEKQLLEHNIELEKLHENGHALMTNIRLACEQRQLQQREKEKLYEEGTENCLCDAMHSAFHRIKYNQEL